MQRPATHHTSTSIGTLIILLLIAAACGRADPKVHPKTLLLGQWRENLQTEKWERIRANPRRTAFPTVRTIHFFPDGTAVIKDVYDDPARGRTRTFTWSLSEDGKTLKTEDASLRDVMGHDYSVQVAPIVALTKKELRIDEPSSANGQFERIE